MILMSASCTINNDGNIDMIVEKFDHSKMSGEDKDFRIIVSELNWLYF